MCSFQYLELSLYTDYWHWEMNKDDFIQDAELMFLQVTQEGEPDDHL